MATSLRCVQCHRHTFLIAAEPDRRGHVLHQAVGFSNFPQTRGRKRINYDVSDAVRSNYTRANKMWWSISCADPCVTPNWVPGAVCLELQLWGLLSTRESRRMRPTTVSSVIWPQCLMLTTTPTITTLIITTTNDNNNNNYYYFIKIYF